MNSIARWEYGVVAGLLVVLLVSIIPAVLHARREQRDGIRRAELLGSKTELEQYYNEHEFYPLTFEASPHIYIVEQAVGSRASHWYLRAELENLAESLAGFDEEYNVYFRIVRDGTRTFYDVCGGEMKCGL